MLDVDAAFCSVDPAALRADLGVKWRRYPSDVLPAWVADMDFPVAPPVRRALRDLADRGTCGYPVDAASSGLAQRFAERAAERWGWSPDPSRTSLVTDVVVGIVACIEAFTEPGDAVLLTTPVYPPFLKVVAGSGRVLAASPLNALGRLDPGDLEATFDGLRPRMVLLCSPHNPNGRVFDARELALIAELADRYDAVIVSDEIHADLVYPDVEFLPTAMVGGEVAARTVTLTSASKAFNVAGLRCALAIAGSPALHARFLATSEVARHSVALPGIVAALAAWTPEGDEWLAACLAQLDTNRRRLAERLAAAAPLVGYRLPEATYLAWLDLRAYGLGDDPARWLLDEAKVALSPGPDFGPPGAGFARLNFATSPAVLEQIIDRIVAALARAPGS